MGEPDSISERVRECAQRIAESGAPALGGLYDLTANRLVRLAVAVTCNQYDAEDAVQAVLVRVADKPQFLSAADQPWHYLLRMVRNEALVILRKRKQTSPLGLIQGLADLITQRFVDQAELQERHRAVWSALRKLPVEQSEVVVLKIWETLTFAQIGEVLDISPATAASRYRYGLQKLETRLAAYGGIDDATRPATPHATNEGGPS